MAEVPPNGNDGDKSSQSHLPEKYYVHSSLPVPFFAPVVKRHGKIRLDAKAHLWKTLMYPSTQPSSREEAKYTAAVYDAMLQEVATEQDAEIVDISKRLSLSDAIFDDTTPKHVTASLQKYLCQELELIDLVQEEVHRQVGIQCCERAQLLESLRTRSREIQTNFSVALDAFSTHFGNMSEELVTMQENYIRNEAVMVEELQETEKNLAEAADERDKALKKNRDHDAQMYLLQEDSVEQCRLLRRRVDRCALGIRGDGDEYDPISKASSQMNDVIRSIIDPNMIADALKDECGTQCSERLLLESHRQQGGSHSIAPNYGDRVIGICSTQWQHEVFASETRHKKDFEASAAAREQQKRKRICINGLRDDMKSIRKDLLNGSREQLAYQKQIHKLMLLANQLAAQKDDNSHNQVAQMYEDAEHQALSSGKAISDLTDVLGSFVSSIRVTMEERFQDVNVGELFGEVEAHISSIHKNSSSVVHHESIQADYTSSFREIQELCEYMKQKLSSSLQAVGQVLSQQFDLQTAHIAALTPSTPVEVHSPKPRKDRRRSSVAPPSFKSGRRGSVASKAPSSTESSTPRSVVLIHASVQADDQDGETGDVMPQLSTPPVAMSERDEMPSTASRNQPLFVAVQDYIDNVSSSMTHSVTLYAHDDLATLKPPITAPLSSRMTAADDESELAPSWLLQRSQTERTPSHTVAGNDAAMHRVLEEAAEEESYPMITIARQMSTLCDTVLAENQELLVQTEAAIQDGGTVLGEETRSSMLAMLQRQHALEKHLRKMKEEESLMQETVSSTVRRTSILADKVKEGDQKYAKLTNLVKQKDQELLELKNALLKADTARVRLFESKQRQMDEKTKLQETITVLEEKLSQHLQVCTASNTNKQTKLSLPTLHPTRSAAPDQANKAKKQVKEQTKEQEGEKEKEDVRDTNPQRGEQDATIAPSVVVENTPRTSMSHMLMQPQVREQVLSPIPPSIAGAASHNTEYGQHDNKEITDNQDYQNTVLRHYVGSLKAPLRSKAWVLKTIRDVYKERMHFQKQREALAGRGGDKPHQTSGSAALVNNKLEVDFSQFVVHFFKHQLGTRALVDRQLTSLVVALQRYRADDVSISDFMAFMDGKWTWRVLILYVKALVELERLTGADPAQRSKSIFDRQIALAQVLQSLSDLFGFEFLLLVLPQLRESPAAALPASQSKRAAVRVVMDRIGVYPIPRNVSKEHSLPAYPSHHRQDETTVLAPPPVLTEPDNEPILLDCPRQSVGCAQILRILGTMLEAEDQKMASHFNQTLSQEG
jgi:hypothetical protein